MNAWAGWALAAAAVVAGFLGYGWPGLALALSVVAFWLLLQFSRALRVMRRAAEKPLGRADSAVMLQARLRPGMTMMQVVTLAGSLGQKLGGAPEEAFLWRDTGGDAVRVLLRGGRVSEVRLERAGAAPAGQEA